MACRHARLACIRCLLEGGATQLPDADGHTPADMAAAAGHSDVLAMIRRHEEVQGALAEQHRQQAAAGAAAAGEGEP
jgi:ankyrin repeat protein